MKWRVRLGVGAWILLITIGLGVPAALVQTFGEDGNLVLDARAIGVAVAAIALALRAPVLVAVTLAAVATAMVRAFR